MSTETAISQMKSSNKPNQQSLDLINEGGRLRKYLQDNAITKDQFAAQLNTTRATISGYYRTGRLQGKVRERILSALGKDYPTVFGQAPPPHEGQQLRKYLDKNDIAKNQLADKLCLKPQSIQSYFSSETFSGLVLAAILKGLGATYQEVFMPQNEVDVVEAIPETKQAEQLPEASHTMNVKIMLSEQLNHWQRFLAKLEADNAPLRQRRFCLQQISHIELSQSAYYDCF